jgi:hypothetical protein
MVSPPDWLATFMNAVVANIHSHDVLSPLGCHFQQVQNIWEVTIFASRTEIVGGPQDGLMYDSGFSIDVNGVQKLFAGNPAVSWQAQSLGENDELGAHLSLEGYYGTKQVWLRITSKAPERFDVGRRALVNQNRIEDVW